MSLGRDMAEAVRVEWSAPRIQAAEVGLRKRRDRRTRARIAASGAIALAVIAWVMWPRPESARLVAWHPPVLAPIAPIAVPQPVAPQRPAPVAPTPTPAVELAELASGARQVYSSDHPLRVQVGKTTRIAARSAKFAGARCEGRLEFDMVRGEVVVATGSVDRTLFAGDTATFVIEHANHPRPVERPEEPKAVATQTWTELARAGQFDEAYAALANTPVRDIADELLLAADVKRNTHHPAEAVEPLQKIVRDHADDPRAPLAAFTLGRVLLEQLARPADAAAAFAQADTLAPSGPLAEDAVAREVEALARASDPRAHDVAAQYVTRFPQGRKLRSVRRLGGL